MRETNQNNLASRPQSLSSRLLPFPFEVQAGVNKSKQSTTGTVDLEQHIMYAAKGFRQTQKDVAECISHYYARRSSGADAALRYGVQ